jgi:hypothetical protein
MFVSETGRSRNNWTIAIVLVVVFGLLLAATWFFTSG